MLSEQGKKELQLLKNPAGTPDWIEVSKKRKLLSTSFAFFTYLPWHDHVSKYYEFVVRLFYIRLFLAITNSFKNTVKDSFKRVEFSVHGWSAQPSVYILLDSRKSVKNTIYLWGLNVLK